MHCKNRGALLAKGVRGFSRSDFAGTGGVQTCGRRVSAKGTRVLCSDGVSAQAADCFRNSPYGSPEVAIRPPGIRDVNPYVGIARNGTKISPRWRGFVPKGQPEISRWWSEARPVGPRGNHRFIRERNICPGRGTRTVEVRFCRPYRGGLYGCGEPVVPARSSLHHRLISGSPSGTHPRFAFLSKSALNLVVFGIASVNSHRRFPASGGGHVRVHRRSPGSGRGPVNSHRRFPASGGGRVRVHRRSPGSGRGPVRVHRRSPGSGRGPVRVHRRSPGSGRAILRIPIQHA